MRTPRFLAPTFLAALAFLAAVASPATAQCVEEKLVSPDPGRVDHYGVSVAVDGNVMAVAARLDDEAGFESGAVYMYRHDGVSWVFEGKLMPVGAVGNEAFGTFVDIDGDLLAVGAPGYDLSAPGKVHMYRWNGSIWALEQTFSADDAANGDWFGYSVGLDGDTVVAGARRAAQGGMDAGAVYAFTFNGTTWSQQQRILAPVPEPVHHFGWSVATDRDRIVVGTTRDDEAATNAGAVFVYKRTAGVWVLEQKLMAADATDNDELGFEVEIDGATIIAGSIFDDWNGGASGSAYVFHRDGSFWSQQAKLTAFDNLAGDRFGVAVSLKDDVAIVGAYRDDSDGDFQAGSAHVFRRSGSVWTETARLRPSDLTVGDRFGFSVAHGDQHAVVGAYRDDEGSNDSGAVFTFGGTSELTPWADLGEGLASSPLLCGAGPLLGDEPVHIGLSGAPLNVSATLVIGISPLYAAFKGGTFVPFPDMLLFGFPTGPSGSFDIDATLPPGLPPGFPFYLQYWMPDATGPAGFGASNALQGILQ